MCILFIFVLHMHSPEVPPKTESSDGYKGSTALALPLDNVTCTCRPSTQPLPGIVYYVLTLRIIVLTCIIIL